MSEDDGKQHLAEQAMAGPSQSHLGARGKVSRREQQGTASSSSEGAEQQQEIHPREEEGDPVPASKGQEAPRKSPTKKVHWKKRVLRRLPYSRPPQQIQGAWVRQVKEKQQWTSVTGVKEGEGSDVLCFQDSSGRQDGNQKQEERDEPIPVLHQILLGQQQAGESHREILEDVREKQDLGNQHGTSVTRVRDGEGEKVPHSLESPMRQHGRQKCEKEDGSASVRLLPEQQAGESDRKIREGDLRSYTGEASSQGSSPEQSAQLRKSPAESPEEGGKGKSHKCSHCGKRFRLPSRLIYNQQVHTGEKPYQCNVCGKSFRWSCDLGQHKYLHSGEKPHECDKCGKSFRKGSHLTRHQRIHSGERPFQCNVCGESFSRASSRRRHQLLHSGEKLFKCAECGKIFAQNSGLAQHQQIHSGERPFQCNVCGKRFRQASTCRRHQFVHSEEKLFKCEECGKSFAQKQGLAMHQQIHSGERPFQCKECGKGFALKQDLARHQRIHSGEKPFQCNICGKSFRRSTNLRRHQSVHSREKVSTCEVCGKSFAPNSGRAWEIQKSEKPTRCEECGKSFSHKSDPEQHPPVDAGEKLHKRE